MNALDTCQQKDFQQIINIIQKVLDCRLHRYGNENSVKLLLEFGSSNKIKNEYDNYPSDEAANKTIKEIILKMNEDKISNILLEAIQNNVGKCIIPLIYKDQIIAKRIAKIDNGKSIFENYKFLEDYKKCYYGTKLNNLISILKYGLLKPLSKTKNGLQINVQENHFQLNIKYYDIENWANAIFATESLFYTCHPCYAESVMSKGQQWSCVIECRIHPDFSLKQILKQKPLPNEPQLNEYNLDKNAIIYRTEKEENVYVTGILFALKDFLETSRSYDKWVKAEILSEKEWDLKF